MKVLTLRVWLENAYSRPIGVLGIYLPEWALLSTSRPKTFFRGNTLYDIGRYNAFQSTRHQQKVPLPVGASASHLMHGFLDSCHCNIPIAAKYYDNNCWMSFVHMCRCSVQRNPEQVVDKLDAEAKWIAETYVSRSLLSSFAVLYLFSFIVLTLLVERRECREPSLLRPTPVVSKGSVLWNLK